MLTPETIAHMRLQQQQVLHSSFASANEVVAWHGAMQAQDYTHAKWAIGLRLPEATDASIERAIESGSIVRTHILRPTWHFVAAQDIRWMMQLTAPQIAAQGASRERELGLDAGIFKRANDAIAKTLQGDRQLTRQELATALEQSGIPTDPSRMVHIMLQAELALVVCNGVRRGKEQTYALLDERVPPSPARSREESLAELARRYFISHAPATLHDFTWWSGLKAGDARAALDSIKSSLFSLTLDGLQYWMPAAPALAEPLQPSIFLLPAFDEYLIAYKYRQASIDPLHASQAITSNGIFKPIVVANGRVRGTWSRTEKRDAVSIETQLFSPLQPAETEGLLGAAEHFGRFLEKKPLTTTQYF